MAHFAGEHKTKDGGHDYSTSDLDAVGEVPSTQTCFRDLMELQKEGKIKHIGVSNFGVLQLQEALATGCKIACNQICYNMIFRACEIEVLPFCIKHNIQVLCYSVLMQGILTGRYSALSDIPEYRRRTRHFDSRTNPKSRHGEHGFEDLLESTLISLKKISEDFEISMTEMAQCWPLSQEGVSTVIVGGTKVAHIEGVGKASGMVLSEECLKCIEEATVELKEAMGGNMDLWQGAVDGVETGRCK
jgi:aryl-alcohol dehydrogenase-like predicted oxidoreductase